MISQFNSQLSPKRDCITFCLSAGFNSQANSQFWLEFFRVRGKTLCIMPSSTTECGKLEPISGIARGELRSTWAERALPKSVLFPGVRISGETAAAGVITPDVNFIEDTKKSDIGDFWTNEHITKATNTLVTYWAIDCYTNFNSLSNMLTPIKN